MCGLNVSRCSSASKRNDFSADDKTAKELAAEMNTIGRAYTEMSRQRSRSHSPPGASGGTANETDRGNHGVISPGRRHNSTVRLPPISAHVTLKSPALRNFDSVMDSPMLTPAEPPSIETTASSLHSLSLYSSPRGNARSVYPISVVDFTVNGVSMSFVRTMCWPDVLAGVKARLHLLPSDRVKVYDLDDNEVVSLEGLRNGAVLRAQVLSPPHTPIEPRMSPFSANGPSTSTA
jgi:hypothetical protein